MSLATLIEILILFGIWAGLVYCVYYFLDRSLDKLLPKNNKAAFLPEALVAFALTWLSMVVLGKLIVVVVGWLGYSF